MGGAIHLFTLVMEPETKALARGLRRRDPDVLGALIAQYEYRLYRYLFYLTGSAETARESYRKRGYEDVKPRRFSGKNSG